jgi:hypothetical protein
MYLMYYFCCKAARCLEELRTYRSSTAKYWMSCHKMIGVISMDQATPLGWFIFRNRGLCRRDWVPTVALFLLKLAPIYCLIPSLPNHKVRLKP